MERGLYIGRFQPYHNGHQSVLERISKQVDEIIIGIGSAQFSHDINNPFTAGERIMMITRSLEGRLPCRYYVIPIEDLQRNALWVAHVTSMAPPFQRVFSSNPLVVQLFHERRIEVESPDMYERDSHSGTEIRKRMLAGGDWQKLVPRPVVDVIEEIHGVERLCRISGTD
ncbi:nicotinamide-nucleotide adenylyltransferase [Methanomicrobium sp. W14]|uniref:nicotinamide-nucleotide adenylyltransferase n=1 Tax=Methanomicrobium sp. W14 TaxID=2817839 RepID=UPI001AE94B48